MNDGLPATWVCALAAITMPLWLPFAVAVAFAFVLWEGIEL